MGNNVKSKQSSAKLNPTKVELAAINRNVIENIPVIAEKVRQGTDFVICGEDNRLFNDYYECYKSSPTLNSVINGVVDYIIGDSCTVEGMDEDYEVNKKGETLEELLRKVVTDYLIYGNAALDIIGNSMYHIPMRNLRSNEDNTVFYYSKNYSKSYGRLKTLRYPKYSPENKNYDHQVLFIKATTDSTYGLPMWVSAFESAYIEKEVAKYHINSLANGFQPSYIVNFNNGIPEDELKTEIEESFTEKFCGSSNASRVMLSFNEDKEHSVEVEKIESDSFNDKYSSLITYARQTIFTAFRASQVLFGIDTDNKGFAETQYNNAAKLFNRTVIKPIQKRFKRIISKVTPIDIVPFSLSENTTNSDTVVE